MHWYKNADGTFTGTRVIITEYGPNLLKVTVDEDVFEMIRHCNLYLAGKDYARVILGGGRYMYLSRLIMNVTDENMEVHHINRNKEDNRRVNLFVCPKPIHKDCDKSFKRIKKNYKKYIGKHGYDSFIMRTLREACEKILVEFIDGQY
jgi:hypothetical protein